MSWREDRQCSRQRVSRVNWESVSIASAMTESFPVKSVEEYDRWFGDGEDFGEDIDLSRLEFHGICTSDGSGAQSIGYKRGDRQDREDASIRFLRCAYDQKIGWLGTHWDNKMPIEFNYAMIKLGDVIDFYTTSDGVLKIPQWASFKFAVDEYLEEAPALKFHPSRVRVFIEDNGVDQLGNME